MFRIGRRFFSNCKIDNVNTVEQRLKNIHTTLNGIFILNLSTSIGISALLIRSNRN